MLPGAGKLCKFIASPFSKFLFPFHGQQNAVLQSPCGDDADSRYSAVLCLKGPSSAQQCVSSSPLHSGSSRAWGQ